MDAARIEAIFLRESGRTAAQDFLLELHVGYMGDTAARSVELLRLDRLIERTNWAGIHDRSSGMAEDYRLGRPVVVPEECFTKHAGSKTHP